MRIVSGFGINYRLSSTSTRLLGERHLFWGGGPDAVGRVGLKIATSSYRMVTVLLGEYRRKVQQIPVFHTVHTREAILHLRDKMFRSLRPSSVVCAGQLLCSPDMEKTPWLFCSLHRRLVRPAVVVAGACGLERKWHIFSHSMEQADFFTLLGNNTL
jgi:hypothetical protein